MNQEKKSKLAPLIKKVAAKYGVKITIGVRNNSVLIVNIISGKLDFVKDAVDKDLKNRLTNSATRDYSYSIPAFSEFVARDFEGKSKNFLLELLNAMNAGNHDRSDYQTDYYDIGWGTDINLGGKTFYKLT